jgi:hypothetical protein
MSNYKRNTASDRDALFGGSSGGGGSKHKKNNGANRDALFGDVGASNSGSRATKPSAPKATKPTATKGYKPKQTTVSSSTGRSVLSGEARAAKMKEAEEYRAKAKKAMSRGVFAKADPLAASMFYKRAADAYQQCGEVRLERIHREAGAGTQMQQGAYATAAADYARAAELSQISNDESIEEKRKEGCRLYNAAANAFRQMGETGKAAECVVNAALALLWDDETTLLSKEALAKMEEAVEAYVPDPMNRYARYRQLGVSAFVDPDAESDVITPDMMALAKEHMVTKAYAYEPLHKLTYVFCHYGEYASALYAVGAATAILEAEGIATLSLSRNYIMETILLLAMGDPVAAERAFLDWHVQKTSYLTSRECKLAEELFRAVLARDGDALDEARSPEGSNRAALSNLNEEMRTIVQQLRVSGVARRQGAMKTSSKAKKAVDDELSRELQSAKVAAKAPKPAKMAVKPADDDVDLDNAFIGEDESSSSGSDLPVGESSSQDESDNEQEEKVPMDAAALNAEMDDLMNDLGLDSDESEEDLDDDDIDLR